MRCISNSFSRECSSSVPWRQQSIFLGCFVVGDVQWIIVRLLRWILKK